jgi:hypothetical protein
MPLIRGGRRYNDGLDGLGSIPGSASLFSSPQRPDRNWAHPASYQMVPATLSPGLKRPGHGDHSPLSNVQIKKGGAIYPLPHMSSYHSS